VREGRTGILTVANQIGGFSTFGIEDLHLLEALAKQIVTIRNVRLTQRLSSLAEGKRTR
jgi:hypothetical protein